MREFSKRFLYLYQRCFWYIGLAKGELLKPLGFWNETIQLLTFLAVWFNFKPNFSSIGLSYILLLLLLTIAGKMIVVLGIVRYNNRISNHQNEEIMEILKAIRELKDELHKK